MVWEKRELSRLLYAAVWVILAVVLLLGGFGIAQQQRDQLYDEERQQARTELHLIQAAVQSALQSGGYHEIQPFLEQWGESNPDVSLLRIVSATQTILGVYKTTKQAEVPLKLTTDFLYSYRGKATLTMVKDLAAKNEKSDLILMQIFVMEAIILAAFGIILRQNYKRRLEAELLAERTHHLDEINQRLQWEVVERQKAEANSRRSHRNQSAINTLLQSSLDNSNLDQQLTLALQLLTAISGQSDRGKAALFILEDDEHNYMLGAQEGLSNEEQHLYQRIPKSRALFHGAVVARKLKSIASHQMIEEGVESMIPTIYPHNAYIIPILLRHRAYGAIVLLVEAQLAFDQETLHFMESVATSLAGLIDKQEAENAVKKHQAEIERLNMDLEKRVKHAVTENRHKDMVMMRQSRMAAMGEMIGNIAHQWRQPLNALSLNLTNVEDAYNYGELNDAILQEQMHKAKRLIKQMSTTIDDFRNFFRPDKQRVRFEIGRVVKDALELVSATFSHHHIRLVFLGSEEVLWAFGYPNETVQVLMIILNNAKDAIHEVGLEDGQVVVKIEKNIDNQAIISIKDNGVGIPQEIMDRLFDPFFTTKTERQGTGIGLYMAKMIVEENMEGTIFVESDENGAAFYVQLPLAKTDYENDM
uniref:histidine kinase n=1 Tax=Magnetococcus massalia (strain MO-1) TaxID=451514 RepID=A0A1S7LNV1_MAGMO|nr:putative hoistidine sensor kinase [Candidatus Magnetococcus massalia]